MRKVIFLLLLVVFYQSSFSQLKKDSLNNNILDATYQNTRDSIGAYTKVDVEATYPGGDLAWRSFLEQNIDLDSAIKDLPKKKTHYKETIIVQFIVCVDGTVCDIKVINKVLSSAKEEAERLIKKSGNWVPAKINGNPVKAYRKQPMTFLYDEY